MYRLLVCLAAIGLACSGCQEPAPRVNASPAGQAEAKGELQDTYAYMIDNGLLADMSVSDVHFLPHRPLLSSLGEQRVQRLAALIHMYGGTIRFSTRESDDALVAQRTTVIKAALAAEGIDTTAEVVKGELPGGRGMDAAQAILIKSVEGTYVPKKKAGADTATAAPTTGTKK